MPEPYHYSLYDAPSGSPRMGTGRADDTPARTGRFLRQLALLLVLGWALSLVGLPLLSELDYQAHKAGLGVLGRFLAELLPPLAVFLLALLLFGRAAARPVPVRILGVCLLFGVCAQLLIVQTMEFLPWQLCAPQAADEPPQYTPKYIPKA